MRYLPGGGYEKMGYEDAIARLSVQLHVLVRVNGPDCIADYLGNPGSMFFG